MTLNFFDLILFDLDGTLRFSDPPGLQTFHRFAGELGLRFDAELEKAAERWAHAYWAQSDQYLADIETFGDRKANGAFWENHARRHLMALGASAAEARALAPVITQKMIESYHPVDCVPEDAVPTLQRLHESGYRLGLVSNRDEPLEGIVAELGLAPLFEFTLAAGEAGFWKPDPRLFRYALDLAGARPPEAVYVGDNYFADVLGAEAAGLQPVLLDPRGIFPDAACPAISTLGDLLETLRSLAHNRREL